MRIRWYLGQAAAIILLAMVDIALVKSLPFGLGFFQTFPIALVFVYLLGNLRLAAAWAICGGLLLEAFTFGSYGFHLVGLGASVALISILFERTITNHSLYSVSVVAMASTLVYDISLLIKQSIDGLAINWGNFLEKEALTLVYSIVFSLAAFYIINNITRRLRPVFLARKNYQL